jgi:hypothetical protein
MGASLLDQVLAETLDPAYARAAEARAARPARDPADGAPRRRRGAPAVALTMAAAGLLVGVTYDQAASGEAGREEVRGALVEDIGAQSDTTADLSAELEDLRG